MPEVLRRETGSDTLVVRADLTRESETRRLFGAALKRFGRVDTLVANAGAWETRSVPLHKLTLRQWRATLDAVLTSAFLSAREFLRLVAKQKRGNAVFIACRNRHHVRQTRGDTDLPVRIVTPADDMPIGS